MHGPGNTWHGKWKTISLAAVPTPRRVTCHQRPEFSGTVGLMDITAGISLPCWRILDTEFWGRRERFFGPGWPGNGDANAPRILHYVACSELSDCSSSQLLLSWTQAYNTESAAALVADAWRRSAWDCCPVFTAFCWIRAIDFDPLYWRHAEAAAPAAVRR
jgi:hypothetical protein